MLVIVSDANNVDGQSQPLRIPSQLVIDHSRSPLTVVEQTFSTRYSSCITSGMMLVSTGTSPRKSLKGEIRVHQSMTDGQCAPAVPRVPLCSFLAERVAAQHRWHFKLQYFVPEAGVLEGYIFYLPFLHHVVNMRCEPLRPLVIFLTKSRSFSTTLPWKVSKGSKDPAASDSLPDSTNEITEEIK